LPIASISIDIDGIACYHAIHGLPSPAGVDPMYSVAMPRFLEALAALAAPATLFAVGQDLARPEAAALLRDAAEAAHEIANHSFSHDYRLSLGDRGSIDAEIARAHQAITDLIGAAPTGFRAPGYNVSEPLFDALEAQGYSYDSSIFPSPAYFALRAGAVGLYRLRGQPSRSIPGDARQFLASRFPYRPNARRLHRAGGDAARRDLIELPISVVPHLRLPFIGTSISMLPQAAAALMTRAVLASRAPINLELHAIDFLDASDPGVDPALAARQRDLAVPAALKLRRLQRVMRAIAAEREVLTLRDVATQVASAEARG